MTTRDELLSVDRFVDRMRGLGAEIGRTAVYAMCQRGELPTIRVGRKLLIVRRRVEELWGVDLSGNGTEAANSSMEPRS